MRKLTQEEFVEKATKVHNGKYDYSKAKYVNQTKKVCIICPIHGEFWQTPSNHLYGAHGCDKCQIDYRKNKIFGVGINDLYESHSKCFIVWYSMLRRCYSKVYRTRFHAYDKCVVCEEWLTYSNFKRWFDENYVEGWHLDKDILSLDKKEYGPSTCCFVPRVINNAVAIQRKDKDLPYGVHKRELKKGTKFYTQVDRTKTSIMFDTSEEAYLFFIELKNKQIRNLAEQFRDTLSPRVYVTLSNINFSDRLNRYKETDPI